MSFQDDLLEIDTPENVAFGYPIAGIGSRFIAALVDTSIIAGLLLAVFILGLILSSTLLDLSPERLLLGDIAGWIAAGLGLLSFVFLWGYYIFFEMLWNGQSPGKRMARLRVIRADGTPISIAESTIRNLVRLIDFLPTFYAVGVVVMFIDGSSRRLGDLAGGTIVVRETDANVDLTSLQPTESPQIITSVRLEGIGVLPLEKLTPEDFDKIDSFVKRRNQFSNPDVVGKHLLEQLFGKMEIQYPFMDRWNTTHLLTQIRSALAHKDNAE